MDAMTDIAYGLFTIVGVSVVLALLIIYLKSKQETQSHGADETNDAPDKPAE